jgi:hypothetical protein
VQDSRLKRAELWYLDVPCMGPSLWKALHYLQKLLGNGVFELGIVARDYRQT